MVSRNLETKPDACCFVCELKPPRNTSQKIHQVTDDREMALDQSTTEIRKCLNEETTSERQFVKSIFFSLER